MHAGVYVQAAIVAVVVVIDQLRAVVVMAFILVVHVGSVMLVLGALVIVSVRLLGVSGARQHFDAGVTVVVRAQDQGAHRRHRGEQQHRQSGDES